MRAAILFIYATQEITAGLQPAQPVKAIPYSGRPAIVEPLEPFCLRWDYPVWRVDETLGPTALKSERLRVLRR